MQDSASVSPSSPAWRMRRRQRVREGHAAPAPARETFGPLRSALALSIASPRGTPRAHFRLGDPLGGAAPFSTSPLLDYAASALSSNPRSNCCHAGSRTYRSTSSTVFPSGPRTGVDCIVSSQRAQGSSPPSILTISCAPRSKASRRGKRCCVSRRKPPDRGRARRGGGLGHPLVSCEIHSEERETTATATGIGRAGCMPVAWGHPAGTGKEGAAPGKQLDARSEQLPNRRDLAAVPVEGPLSRGDFSPPSTSTGVSPLRLLLKT